MIARAFTPGASPEFVRKPFCLRPQPARDGGAVRDPAGKALPRLQDDRTAIRADDLQRLAKRINEDARGTGQLAPRGEGAGLLPIGTI